MDLFMESGIDRTYISAVERGIQSPTIRMIVRFANCLKVRPSDLVRRMEQSPRYSARGDLSGAARNNTYYVLNSNIKIPIASFILLVVVANVPDTMSSDDTKPFRERLRMLRESKGLSQTKLEERIGKEDNYITRVETGRIMPPLDVIVQIAREFDMSVNDLFFVEGIDDSAEALRAKIHRLIETDDVKRLRKYYRLLLASDEE